MDHEQLTGAIIGAAMKVHSTLGAGFLESVYKLSLSHELRKSGMTVECETPITVIYDGVVVGSYFADLIVERAVIVEIKAVQSLAVVHEVQLVNYLTATGIDVGLLINFGGSSLAFKRKHRGLKPKLTE